MLAKGNLKRGGNISLKILMIHWHLKKGCGEKIKKKKIKSSDMI